MIKLFISGLLLCSALFAQEKQIIENIRGEYSQIKMQLNSFKKDTLEISGISTEGSVIVTYKNDSGCLRLLTAWHYGEMGKHYQEYYLKNDSLIFSYSEMHHYNAPINLTEEIASAIGSEPFDPQKTTMAENRYYFHQNRLIRWLDSEKKMIAVSDTAFKNKEKEIFNFWENLLRELKETKSIVRK